MGRILFGGWLVYFISVYVATLPLSIHLQCTITYERPRANFILYLQGFSLCIQIHISTNRIKLYLYV